MQTAHLAVPVPAADAARVPAHVHAARRVAAAVHSRVATVRGDRGQGTVEYVALLLLIAAVFGGVIAAGGGKIDIGTTIANKLKDVVSSVGDAKPKN